MDRISEHFHQEVVSPALLLDPMEVVAESGKGQKGVREAVNIVLGNEVTKYLNEKIPAMISHVKSATSSKKNAEVKQI